MSNKEPIIRTRRSYTASVAPKPGQLPEGQLAANAVDGKTYIGNQVNDPVLLSSRQAADIRVFETDVEEELTRINAILNIKSGLSVIDDISLLFNNTDRSFPITINGEPYEPETSSSIQVILDGVYQYPASSYVVSEDQIVFYEPPTTGQKFYGIILADRSGLIGNTDIAVASISPTQLDRRYIEADSPALENSLSFPSNPPSEPALRNQDNPGTGLFSDANTIGLSVNGESQLQISSGRLEILSPSFRVPFGPMADRPQGEEGLSRINTDNEEFEFYVNGGWRNLQSGATNSPTNTILDDISSEFNGVTSTFDLSSSNGNSPVEPSREGDTLIFLNSVYQIPGRDFTISGSAITFSQPPAASDSFYGMALTGSYVVGTVSPLSVNTENIVPGIELSLSSGNSSNPSLSFNDSTDNAGIYFSPSGENLIGFSVGGQASFTVLPYGIGIPQGENSNRPSSPDPGVLRYSNSSGQLEYWGGSQWESLYYESKFLNPLPYSAPSTSKITVQNDTLSDTVNAVVEELDAAYVYFDGTPSNPNVSYSKNISSVTKSSAGNYLITFDTPAPNTEFIATYNASAPSFKKISIGEELQSRTVSSVEIKCGPSNTPDTDLEDYENIVARFKW